MEMDQIMFALYGKIVLQTASCSLALKSRLNSVVAGKGKQCAGWRSVVCEEWRAEVFTKEEAWGNVTMELELAFSNAITVQETGIIWPVSM